MSFQAMAWAVKQKLPSREKFILIMLANYADENSTCWPSNGRLCDELGMSKNTLLAGLRALAELGIIEIIKRSEDGYTLPNKYRLQIERVGSNSERGVVRQLNGGGSNFEPKPIIEPITKDSIVGFETFWMACPRRIGKEAARKAYVKARKQASDAELLAGIRRYAASRAGQDETYTAHPATWLHQGRWADEPAGYQSAMEPKREMSREEQIEASRRFWAQYEEGKNDQR